jgi:hypothetical protein
MGWLCDQVVKTGGFAIADFICPTEETRKAFLQGGPAFVVWVDRIERSRYEDTNRLFEPPAAVDIRVAKRIRPNTGLSRWRFGCGVPSEHWTASRSHAARPATPRCAPIGGTVRE